MASTYLDGILAWHRARAAADTRELDALIEQAATVEATRGFRVGIEADDDLSVIAEVKRRSPSKGDLLADLDPARMAHAYEAGGATCISVLTDTEHFGGSADDLAAARHACHLPVLRKDFTVDPRDVADARLMGADCVLLIVAALDDAELASLASLARDLQLDALVEVHDEGELARALAVGADMVGVNQRDLHTFAVDHERAERVGAAIPDGVVAVAESGVRGVEDALRLRSAGFDAVLVGESLVTDPDPSAAVARLRAGT